MTYISCISDSYPKKLIGTYDEDRSPDRLMFLDGKYIKEKLPMIYVKVNSIIDEAIKYNNIQNTADVFLVDEKVRDILDDLCEFDIQYFDAIIECKDGTLDNYKIVNITHTILAINHENSNYSTFDNSKTILGFQHLALKCNCLGNHEIARDMEYVPHTLVSQKLYDAFKKNKIKGITLITEEQFNNIGKVRIP